jgi:hypothetical protein
MLGIDAKETVEFTSAKDTGDKKTVFVLGAFTNRDRLRVFGGAMDEKGKFDVSKFSDKIFDVLKVGVKSIKHRGKDYDGIPEELLDGPNEIKLDILVDVFEKIMESNFPSEAETKN